MVAVQPMLFAWYIFMIVLAVLLRASAGKRSWVGQAALVAVLLAILLLVTLLRPVTYQQAITLGAPIAVLVIGLLATVRAPRQDTRLIGLLLAGSAIFPLVLFFA
jgi:hypothetical protein